MQQSSSSVHSSTQRRDTSELHWQWEASHSPWHRPFFLIGAEVSIVDVSVPGRVLVHCLMGVSRSATLVLAFLMIVEGLTLREAVAAVRPHRDICPNPGFLQQLRILDMSLERERKRERGQTL